MSRVSLFHFMTHDSFSAFFWHIQFSIVQYIPRNMYTVCALLIFIVVMCRPTSPKLFGIAVNGSLPLKQSWPIKEDESYKPTKNDDLTTTKQITTKRWVFFMGSTAYIEAILASYMLTSPRQMGRGSDKNIRHSWNNLRYLLLFSYIKANKSNFPRI